MTDGTKGRLITDRLFEIAERECDRELIFDPEFGRYTYGDVAGQVDRLAIGLRQHGFEPGDMVVIQLPNWAPFLIFHLALTRIGAVTVNIPIVYREHELKRILDLTEAKGLVLPVVFRGHDYRAMSAALQRDNSGLRHVFLVGDETVAEAPGMFSYEALMRRSWESAAASLEALIGQFASVLSQPMTMLAGTLGGAMSKLARTLSSVADQKSS